MHRWHAATWGVGGLRRSLGLAIADGRVPGLLILPGWQLLIWRIRGWRTLRLTLRVNLHIHCLEVKPRSTTASPF